jgi:acylphosphatase/fructose-specific phosphotransferase system component IIB
MIRATLYISGDVQHVNYRSKVIRIAEKYHIKGNVQNLSNGNVKVIAEGQENEIERFIHDINIRNSLINVATIEKEYSTPTGEYESFYKLVSEGETDERLDTAADLLKELINVTRNGFSGLEKKQDIMIEKQDIMIGKQDIMIEKQDIMIGKQDIMIGTQHETIRNIENLGVQLGNKIDQNRLEIKSEIHALRDDFKSFFDERLSKMEIELAEIKIKVAQIQHSS